MSDGSSKVRSARANVRRLPVVGVMGSGELEHPDLAEPLGRKLAGSGVHLLTGGGGGVMTAVSRAFHAVAPREGLVIGIAPGDEDGRAKPGYPNAYVEIVVRTHLPFSGAEGEHPLSRNHLNVLTADLVIALPGGAGTSSEVRLALRYGRPLIAYVHAREDIADLPVHVNATDDLEVVWSFVRRHLSGA